MLCISTLRMPFNYNGCTDLNMLNCVETYSRYCLFGKYQVCNEQMLYVLHSDMHAYVCACVLCAFFTYWYLFCLNILFIFCMWLKNSLNFISHSVWFKKTQYKKYVKMYDMESDSYCESNLNFWNLTKPNSFRRQWQVQEPLFVGMSRCTNGSYRQSFGINRSAMLSRIRKWYFWFISDVFRRDMTEKLKNGVFWPFFQFLTNNFINNVANEI